MQYCPSTTVVCPDNRYSFNFGCNTASGNSGLCKYNHSHVDVLFFGFAIILPLFLVGGLCALIYRRWKKRARDQNHVAFTPLAINNNDESGSDYDDDNGL
jgi:hypothetical protein